jgi:hypothetical protein
MRRGPKVRAHIAVEAPRVDRHAFQLLDILAGPNYCAAQEALFTG